MTERDIRRDDFPGDSESFANDSDLLPAIRLLNEAAPRNGIDLVPRWNAIIAAERTRAERPIYRWSRWVGQSMPLRYAALLAIGAGVGGFAVTALADREADGAPSLTLSVPDERPHYTASQRTLMFAMLESTTAPSENVLALASQDLARCVVCHDGGLKEKLDAWRP